MGIRAPIRPTMRPETIADTTTARVEASCRRPASVGGIALNVLHVEAQEEDHAEEAEADCETDQVRAEEGQVPEEAQLEHRALDPGLPEAEDDQRRQPDHDQR